MAEAKAEAFDSERKRLNELVMQYAGRDMKRFWALQNQVYEDGELPAKTKEMLGLAASLALRCDDCVLYHLARCRDCGVSAGAIVEVLSIGLIVGGSIAIPHVRRAIAALDEMISAEGKGETG
ncbi:carboxymuconolactone decarboxylase family protein [bacterium]|nr:carboxymuconolactone decarboxylase family protein [bacterium]